MPVIREYESRTRSVGANQGPAYSGQQFGAAQGEAASQLGGAIQGTAEVVAKKIDQQNTSDVTAKLTKANADLTIDLQNVIRTAAPGDKTAFEDYQKRAEETIDAIGESASTSGARTFYSEASARIKGQLAKTSADGQAELAGIKAVQDYSITQNSLSAAAMADPSSLMLQRELHTQNIENLVNSGQLPREKAMQLQTQGDQQLSKAAMRGWTNLNPDYAKEKLKSGEFDATLGADGKAQMLGEIDQAVRAKEIEAERRLREQERIVKMQQEKTQNEFLSAMTKGGLTTKAVLNSNLEAFGSGSKEQFLNMLKMKNSPDEKLKTDPSTMISLFNRIHLPDDDPNKLRDDNALNDYFGKGLSLADIGRLRDEIQGKNTEAGSIESDMKRGLVDIAKGKLTKSNPLTGFRDPLGDEQMQKFQAWFLDTYKEQRAAGKSSAALLNPDSPEYLGKYISNFTRTNQQIMQSLVPKKAAPVEGGLSMTPGTAPAGATPATYKAPLPPAVPARLPGESAAAFLKRSKGK